MMNSIIASAVVLAAVSVVDAAPDARRLRTRPVYASEKKTHSRHRRVLKSEDPFAFGEERELLRVLEEGSMSMSMSMSGEEGSSEGGSTGGDSGDRSTEVATRSG